jgi:tRNA(Arg) A34 adenosine deaminase TadA
MNKFLERAMGVALTSSCRYRHGAIVVKHGHVLGSGTNRIRNDPKYVDWRSSSIHAEIVALRRASFPKRATIYVARVNRLGEPRLSKPCANCQEVLDGLRIKVIHT